MTKYPNRSHPGVAGAKYQLGKAVIYIHAITRQLSRSGEDSAAEIGNHFADEILRVMQGKPSPRIMSTAEMLQEQDEADDYSARMNARGGAA